MKQDLDRFHIVDAKGRELTRLAADVMLYLDYPLGERRDDVLAILEAFYQLCPKDAMAWYASETMTQFKPATSRAHMLPATWWKNGAPQKPLRELQLKCGANHDSVATCGIYLRSAERSNRSFRSMSNYVRFIVETTFVETSYQRFVDFVHLACDRLPFVSGHGGYVIECNQYHPNEAQAAAYPLAMRFQGVDIATMSRGPWAVRHERVKNAAWLTLVGAGLLEKIGGIKGVEAKATDRLAVLSTRHGVVIRAGERPILGDVNRREDLQAYIDAYRLVEPLQAGIETLFAPFDLPGKVDATAATERWLVRFAKKES